MALFISSAQNPRIKRLLTLQQKGSERRRSSLFVLEGRREIGRALSCGYEAESFFLCPDICPGEDLNLDEDKVFTVSPEVYAKIAYREGTEGLIAVLRSKEHRLEDIKLGSNPLIAVVESVEKPGNLGAMMRTCDAAGADALIVCDPLTDLYNPNLLRASLGTAFSVQCAVCSSEMEIDYLKQRGIRILTAQLQDSSLYCDCPMTSPCAIVMGTEATGLSEAWRQAADAHIRIPMNGIADSLNVSVSAAILLYEAVRQRNG